MFSFSISASSSLFYFNDLYSWMLFKSRTIACSIFGVLLVGIPPRCIIFSYESKNAFGSAVFATKLPLAIFLTWCGYLVTIAFFYTMFALIYESIFISLIRSIISFIGIDFVFLSSRPLN